MRITKVHTNTGPVELKDVTGLKFDKDTNCFIANMENQEVIFPRETVRLIQTVEVLVKEEEPVIEAEIVDAPIKKKR